MADRVSEFFSSVGSNAAGFGKFVYNSEDGTVMGRNGSSWIRICIFYAFYYLFLAGLFALSLSLTSSLLGDEMPFFQTRLQYPGMTIMPKTNKFSPKSLDIKFDMNDPASYKAYVDGIDAIMSETYNASSQTDVEKFQDCSKNPIITGVQTANKLKSCQFDAATLITDEMCKAGGTDQYGYLVGKPCIYLKLNKVINWEPAPFFDFSVPQAGSDTIVKGDGIDSKAPNILTVLKAQGLTYDKNHMYAACYGMNPEDQKNLDVGTTAPHKGISYSPTSIPNYYYPYKGSRKQAAYISPIIAVKFGNVKKNVDIKVGCKIYARNLADIMRINVGYIGFNMHIKG